MELLMLPKDSARRTMFVAEALESLPNLAEALGAAAATGAGAGDAGGAAAGSSAAAGGFAAATTSMSATLESTGWRLLRLPKLRARRTVAAISSTLASQDSCRRNERRNDLFI